MKTLSSPLTFFSKYVFPVIWVVILGMAVIAPLANPPGGPPAATDDFTLAFSAAWIAGAVFLFVTCGNIKRVRVEGDKLYISNYLREIAVPLTEIQEVTENRLLNHRPITLHFKTYTGFGRSVRFFPAERRLPWKDNPLVNLLAAAAEEGRLAEQATEKPAGRSRFLKFFPFVLLVAVLVGWQISDWVRFRDMATRERTANGSFLSGESDAARRINTYSFIVDGKTYDGIWPRDAGGGDRNGQPVLVYYDAKDPSENSLREFRKIADDSFFGAIICAVIASVAALAIWAALAARNRIFRRLKTPGGPAGSA